MNDNEIDEMFEFTLKLARQCGVLIKTAYDLPKEIVTKSSEVDLVTETDELVERTIIDAITKRYADHEIIGEESTAAGKAVVLTERPTWVIDPVDGTTNFVCGFPYIAVCIGVMVNKKPVIGVVYNPIMDHMYCARIGKGATLNNQSIKVNSCKGGVMQMYSAF